MGKRLPVVELVSVFAGSVYWVSIGPTRPAAVKSGGSRCRFAIWCQCAQFRRETAPGAFCGLWGAAGPRAPLGIVSPIPPENLALVELRRHNRLGNYACRH